MKKITTNQILAILNDIKLINKKHNITNEMSDRYFSFCINSVNKKLSDIENYLSMFSFKDREKFVNFSISANLNKRYELLLNCCSAGSSYRIVFFENSQQKHEQYLKDFDISQPVRIKNEDFRLSVFSCYYKQIFSTFLVDFGMSEKITNF